MAILADHVERQGLLPEEQKALRKRRSGLPGCSYHRPSSCRQGQGKIRSRHEKSELTSAPYRLARDRCRWWGEWTIYRKAYDTVPHPVIRPVYQDKVRTGSRIELKHRSPPTETESDIESRLTANMLLRLSKELFKRLKEGNQSLMPVPMKYQLSP